MDENKTHHETPFNEAFCTRLEFQLGRVFKQSNKKDIKDFWCDGVSWQPMPESQLSHDHLNKTKRIITKAWIGKDGQDEYNMTLEFGIESMNCYSQGGDLATCIPNLEDPIWFEIDTKIKEIIVRLK